MERWKQLNKLLESALDLPRDQRDTWLEQKNLSDEMKQELRELIAIGDDDNSILDEPLLSHDSSLPAETMIGPYCLKELLGQGGMGSVYRAIRDDGEFNKEVAIKLINPGVKSRLVQLRFQKERQILANLDHPNIASLYDGGTTEDGQAYFAMEYIEGKPIDEFCNEHGYNLQQRLALFEEVCRTVQFAHGNLVVHRDLKPANILVRESGRPCLLDFGIARLIGSEADDLSLTTTGVRPMSPNYASPEQIRGEQISISSDIYALGVLLYQMLTNKLPYQLEKGSLAELEQAICHEDVARPSLALDTSLSKRAVQGDVDTITLKALRKEQRERYATASDFAEDIRRYLDGFPILARPQSWQYELGKFYGRHRLASLSALVFLALIFFFSFYTQQKNRQITLERDRSYEVTRFLVALFKVSEPSQARGDSITAREILDKGSRALKRDLQEQPEVRATMMQTIGEVYRNLGLFDRSKPLLSEALELRKQIGNPVDIGETQASLAQLMLDSGEYAAADAHVQQAIIVFRSMTKTDTPQLLSALKIQGDLLAHQAEFNKAETHYRDLLKREKALHGARDPRVAKVLSGLAFVLRENGAYDKSQELLKLAITINRDQLGEPHPSLVSDHLQLGEILLMVGQAAEGQTQIEKALAMQELLVGKDTQDRSRTLELLGMASYYLGDYEQAETMQREALALDQRHLGQNNPKTASSLSNLAVVLTSRNKLQEAKEITLEALAIKEQIHGPTHSETATSLNNLGDVLYELGEFDEAEARLEESLSIRRLKWDSNHYDVLESLQNFSKLISSRGGFRKAYRLLNESMDGVIQLVGKYHPRSIGNRIDLGVYYLLDGRSQEAVDHFQLLRSDVEQHLGENHETQTSLNHFMARALVSAGKLSEGKELYQHLKNHYAEIYGPDDLSVGQVLMETADVALLEKDIFQATQLLRDARQLMKDSKGVKLLFLESAEASLLGLCGAPQEAEKQLWRCHFGIRDKLGPFSWPSIVSRSRIINFYRHVNRPDLAEMVVALGENQKY